MGVAPPLLSLNYSCHLSPIKFVIMVFGLGELPKAYNPKVHGPYDPAVYEVKVGELPKWLARRDKSIGGIGKAISRGYWRYCHNYVFPKRTKIAPVVHFFLGASVFFYLINYQKMAHHR